MTQWKLEHRQWGQGTCFGCGGTVLAFGKWAVVGSTGQFRVIHPNGWEEDKPVFETEAEAMKWVESRSTKTIL